MTLKTSCPEKEPAFCGILVNQRFKLLSEAAHVLGHVVLASGSQHTQLHQDARQLAHHNFHSTFAKHVPIGDKLVVHAEAHLIEELRQAVRGRHVNTVTHQGVAALVSHFRLAEVA
ncbi:hypothetical protein EYF80_000434 [Liparis tanakae]|uniref:Uncharacterized protein n=1 Tax=Liparis tanakae TaxID=230148 RepID=A0A4Z2JFW8_9TELE|nr:hypothetical protein EYF80_000434 [Liparis tanakae]